MDRLVEYLERTSVLTLPQPSWRELCQGINQCEMAKTLAERRGTKRPAAFSDRANRMRRITRNDLIGSVVKMTEAMRGI
jgi:hypothetical protein